MTTLEKLKALLPEKMEDRAFPNWFSDNDKGYNRALNDISSLLPKMIEVVREEVAESERERVLGIIEQYQKHSSHNPYDTCLEEIIKEIKSI